MGILCLAGRADAQVQPGLPNFSAYDAHEVDTVNLMSNDTMITVPIMSKNGAAPFSANYFQSNYAYVTSGIWYASFLLQGNVAIPGFGPAAGPLFVNYGTLVFNATCPDGHTLTSLNQNAQTHSSESGTERVVRQQSSCGQAIALKCRAHGQMS
jgi:hypothetical protein